MSHSVVNGVPVPWPGHPTVVGPPSAMTPWMLDEGVQSALKRVMTSSLLGLASLASGFILATAATAAVLLLGAPMFFLAAWAPASLLLGVGGLLTLRGKTARQALSESQVLESAHRRGGVLTVATLALDTGSGLSECQKQLDAMVAAGWVTMDVTDDGLLTYRIAAFGPEGTGVRMQRLPSAK